MRIVFDIDVGLKNKLNPAEFFYLASLYYGYPIFGNIIKNLNEKGYLVIEDIDIRTGFPTDVSISSDGREIFESIVLGSEFKGTSTEIKLKDLAIKMREIFPEGKKPETNYMWRDSVSIIETRLKALIKKYNVKLDPDKVLRATKAYVSSFNGDYRYMQLLKYFILKKNILTGEENSQLLSFIENIDNAEENSQNKDWTTNMV